MQEKNIIYPVAVIPNNLMVNNVSQSYYKKRGHYILIIMFHHSNNMPLVRPQTTLTFSSHTLRSHSIFTTTFTPCWVYVTVTHINTTNWAFDTRFFFFLTTDLQLADTGLHTEAATATKRQFLTEIRHQVQANVPLKLHVLACSVCCGAEHSLGGVMPRRRDASEAWYLIPPVFYPFSYWLVSVTIIQTLATVYHRPGLSVSVASEPSACGIWPWPAQCIQSPPYPGSWGNSPTQAGWTLPTETRRWGEDYQICATQ